MTWEDVEAGDNRRVSAAKVSSVHIMLDITCVPYMPPALFSFGVLAWPW